MIAKQGKGNMTKFFLYGFRDDYKNKENEVMLYLLTIPSE